jgi:hypothetical protein
MKGYSNSLPYQLRNDEPVFREQHSLEYSDPGCFPQNPIKIPKVIREKMNARAIQTPRTA